MNTQKLDMLVDQVKQLTKDIDRRMISPVLVCCAVEVLADLFPCKHKECFKPGIDLLVKLLVSQAMLSMEKRGFDSDEVVKH